VNVLARTTTARSRTDEGRVWWDDGYDEQKDDMVSSKEWRCRIKDRQQMSQQRERRDEGKEKIGDLKRSGFGGCED
jgi:hypothetical protein